MSRNGERERIEEQARRWPPRCSPPSIDFLATRFKLPGGAIRSRSLSAAFQAADDGGVIEMRHLVRAVALEYGKQGRLTLERRASRSRTCARARC